MNKLFIIGLLFLSFSSFAALEQVAESELSDRLAQAEGQVAKLTKRLHYLRRPSMGYSWGSTIEGIWETAHLRRGGIGILPEYGELAWDVGAFYDTPRLTEGFLQVCMSSISFCKALNLTAISSDQITSDVESKVLALCPASSKFVFDQEEALSKGDKTHKVFYQFIAINRIRLNIKLLESGIKKHEHRQQLDAIAQCDSLERSSGVDTLSKMMKFWCIENNKVISGWLTEQASDIWQKKSL